MAQSVLILHIARRAKATWYLSSDVPTIPCSTAYFLTATVRDDGSSRFKEHWAWFPSFAFAWKANEEAFLKNADWLSDLELPSGLW